MSEDDYIERYKYERLLSECNKLEQENAELKRIIAESQTQKPVGLFDVYNVFHEEEFVGSFLQGSFSTREIAQKWIDSQVGNGKFDGELSISPYTLDSLLNASKEGV